MKKIGLSILLSSSLLFSSGIPVVDAVANAQSLAQNIQEIATWAEEASRWIETTTHYADQIQAYEDQLLSQTEIRDSVQFIKDIRDFSNFAKNYNGSYMNLTTDVLSGNSIIAIKARSLFDRYNIFDDCEENYYTSVEKNICKNKMTRRVQEIAVYQEANTSLGSITDDLNSLANKLANSTDIKESQDINNAIQMKMAQVEVIKTQIELFNQQSKSLDQIDIKNKEQEFKKSLRKADTQDYSNAFGN
ncbi:hypothetical protein CP965_05375 [Halarcobacter mediterraneus]|uniref:Type IV secretion system protein VirB5 n=1 Tax=Halarcobacter mediterraneus TaxID=2023153 RepID=A0A4Q1AW08_9BACT|nr:type IV secretion system protein [Halarcobacter mediterraneus]RXK13231.1 hypothetical protein CP965_05375 [Halarcobacter mediterraneus]